MIGLMIRKWGESCIFHRAPCIGPNGSTKWLTQRGTPDGYLFGRVAHYGELNGDLMRDPEMVFIKAPVSGDYFPSYFRNDYIGCERLGVVSAEQIEGRTFFNFNSREQADEASFANTWMRNIRHQQRLFEKKPAVAA